jgi:hypothetical protein
MASLYSRIKTWNTGEVLTASALNAEFNNILSNASADKLVGLSSSIAAMRAIADPGEDGSESLASSVQGEIQRLRSVLVELSGQNYWYETPDQSIAQIVANDWVTNARMADNSVNTAELVNSSVTEVKLASNAVAEAKIASNAVTTAKIANNSVTAAKLAAPLYSVSSSSGAFSSSSAFRTSVTNLSVSLNIVETDRPVVVLLQPDDGTDPSEITLSGGSQTGFLYLGGLSGDDRVFALNERHDAGGFVAFGLPISSGSNNYTVELANNAFVTTSVSYMKLVAYQL